MCFFLGYTVLSGLVVDHTTQSLLRSTIFSHIFSDRKQRSRYSNATHSEQQTLNLLVAGSNPSSPILSSTLNLSLTKS
ncbi:hypothetical protein PQG02_19470 [Nostoc sp. UHCC 0926]|uniref:hypothetical protein n=1 Tax=unclassified Nostoc TaxID=2593658 RepID=UPI0023619E3B|nr:hypothetical protein [Nostoc sp. UHCC 0926]WDD30914.1 hypothetical protein PQG02_19470 [Nostoc sp. UHCC 0926]